MRPALCRGCRPLHYVATLPWKWLPLWWIYSKLNRRSKTADIKIVGQAPPLTSLHNCSICHYGPSSDRCGWVTRMRWRNNAMLHVGVRPQHVVWRGLGEPPTSNGGGFLNLRWSARSFSQFNVTNSSFTMRPSPPGLELPPWSCSHQSAAPQSVYLGGRAVAQAVSHQSLTAEAWVCPCGICGGQSGSGTCFSLSSSVFSCQYHFIVALYFRMSSGGWTLGLLQAADQRHCLTPSTRTIYVCLSIYLSIYLSTSLSIYLSIHPPAAYIYLHFHKPTHQCTYLHCMCTYRTK
jgi:hypothetical protein